MGAGGTIWMSEFGGPAGLGAGEGQHSPECSGTLTQRGEKALAGVSEWVKDSSKLYALTG